MNDDLDRPVPPEIRHMLGKRMGGIFREYTSKQRKALGELPKHIQERSELQHKKSYNKGEVLAAMESMENALICEYSPSDPENFRECYRRTEIPETMTPSELEGLIRKLHLNLVTAGFLPPEHGDDVILNTMIIDIVEHTKIDWIREKYAEQPNLES